MKTKLIIMSLSIFLLTGISTSSFFLNKYLTQVILKKEHSVSQLSFAINHNNLAALSLAWDESTLHSAQWLTLGKKLAKTQGDAAYQLARYYQNKDKPQRAIFWYKNAIRLQSKSASIALAQYYFEHDKLTDAASTIAILPIDKSNELIVKAITLKINIAISQGNTTDIEQLTTHYDELLQKTSVGRLLLNDIEKYQIQFNESELVNVNQPIVNCDNSIQLFATRLNDLKNLEKTIVNFKEQTISQFVCFTPVRYMPINALNCSNDPMIAITCDELAIQSWAKTINTRFVGLMLPKGGANVHLGMLYFDAKDTVDVFAHEISHLLGFVDEYPLNAEHLKCQAPQKATFSQNVSILKKRYQGNRKDIRAKVLKQLAWSDNIKKSTPILQRVSGVVGNQLWQLGTPKEFSDNVGVFEAQTCNITNDRLNKGFSAFKGVSERTKLQYFALSFPELYTKLLQSNSAQYRMPSFHYNIALAYFHKGKSIEQSQNWIKQAERWESDLERKKKVRTGGF